MKIFGSISRLVSVLFRKDGQDITVRPNQSTTYTAARDIQLPAGDADAVLASAADVANKVNKSGDTMTGDLTLTGAGIRIDVTNGTGDTVTVLPTEVSITDGSNTSTLDASNLLLGGAPTLAQHATTKDYVDTELGLKVTANSAITGATKTKITYDSKGLVTAGADLAASDLPTGIDAAKLADGSVSNTEFQYLGNVTSDIQSQLNGKQADVITTQGDLIVGDASGDAARLAIGANGYILQSNGTTASWQPAPSSTSSFKTNWSTADGTSKTIVHNLGSTDLIVQLWDATTNQKIEVNTVVRTDSNTLDLTASEAPASSWRVVILAV